MGFQDVASLPTRVSFPPPFLKIVVVVIALGPSHVIKLWYGVKQGHAPCKILLLQQNLFLCQLNFMKIIRLSLS